MRLWQSTSLFQVNCVEIRAPTSHNLKGCKHSKGLDLRVCFDLKPMLDNSVLGGMLVTNLTTQTP